MTSSAQEYASASRELLAKAREELREGDLRQASEKLWGAAAQMVKAVAQRRGWPHGGHRDLFQVVNRVAEEAADPVLRDLFHQANSLHNNFYEHWMPREFVEGGADRIEELVNKLERS